MKMKPHVIQVDISLNPTESEDLYKEILDLFKVTEASDSVLRSKLPLLTELADHLFHSGAFEWQDQGSAITANAGMARIAPARDAA